MAINIHPTAEVQTPDIGEGTTIWQYCVILKGARIGKDCNINYNVFIENDVVVGDNVTVKSGVQLWDGIRIGNDVFIGPNATFTNDHVPRSKVYPEVFDMIQIDQGASIGANATIIGPRTIGKYSLIAAGAVVIRDVEPFSVVVGNPARNNGYVTKDKILLDPYLRDKRSGAQYMFENGEIIVKP